MAQPKAVTPPHASREHTSQQAVNKSGWSTVPTATHPLSDRDFALNYRDAMRPVLLRGACTNWAACQRWTPQYFDRAAGTLTAPIKSYDKSGQIKVTPWRLADYAQFVAGLPQDSNKDAQNAGAIPYCHDIPLLGLVESLAGDCQPFPANFLSPAYRQYWWRYSQFFMGPAGTVTPLHFDTLLSHNLFFQISGTKQFTIFPPNQAKYCGRRGWRWFDLDPERPDQVRFPQYARTTPAAITVNAGDILYMPPGTLHHVRGVSASISFNIDFHTRRSVLQALARSYRGMPRQSVYYNAVTALAVVAGMPESVTFPLYRPYLSYIS